jgi:hypothetical protein
MLFVVDVLLNLGSSIAISFVDSDCNPPQWVYLDKICTGLYENC